MSRDLYYLSQAQLQRIRPYFPLSRGVSWVDDRKILSGIIYVIKNGLQRKDAPSPYGPCKTLYNRFIRWSRLGIFNKIFMELSRKNGSVGQLMIDVGQRSVCSKRGFIPMHRAHKGRDQYQTARSLRRTRQTHSHGVDSRTDKRP